MAIDSNQGVQNTSENEIPSSSLPRHKMYMKCVVENTRIANIDSSVFLTQLAKDLCMLSGQHDNSIDREKNVCM